MTPSKKLITEDIPSEFKKWGAEKYLDNLTLSTWAGLKKITGYFDLIILDEEQFATAKNCENIIKGKLKGRIISMTGTPSTRSDKEELYHQMRLHIAYELSLDEAIALGIVDDYQITVACVDMSEENNIKGGSKDKPFMTNEASYYRYIDKLATASYGSTGYGGKIPWQIVKRVNLIKHSETKKELARRLIANRCQGRTLIFAPFIEYSEELCPNTYHSKSPDKSALEQFQNFEIDQIAMVNAGGVGFTFEGIEYLVLVQMDSNKTGMSTQKIARALLKQEGNDKVQIYVLCLSETKDEDWVASGLSGLDHNKIAYVNFDLADREVDSE